MSNTVMVVCNIYKLFKDGNTYSKESKKIERTEAVIERSWANIRNDNYLNVGKWYEIDEEKTAQWYEKAKEIRENRLSKKQKSQRLTKMASDMLEKANDVVDQDISELDELRVAYKSKFNKRPYHGWGVEELTEKLK